MKHFEVFLAVMLLPLPVLAADHAIPARVATLTIDPREVTILNLRPEFESSIRMPEDVTSVILGSPGAFKAEHNEGEPQYVYVKPITKEPAQSNLLIATKSGQHVTIELISRGHKRRKRHATGGLPDRVPHDAQFPGCWRYAWTDSAEDHGQRPGAEDEFARRGAIIRHRRCAQVGYR